MPEFRAREGSRPPRLRYSWQTQSRARLRPTALLVYALTAIGGGAIPPQKQRTPSGHRRAKAYGGLSSELCRLRWQVLGNMCAYAGPGACYGRADRARKGRADGGAAAT